MHANAKAAKERLAAIRRESEQAQKDDERTIAELQAELNALKRDQAKRDAAELEELTERGNKRDQSETERTYAVSDPRSETDEIMRRFNERMQKPR